MKRLTICLYAVALILPNAYGRPGATAPDQGFEWCRSFESWGPRTVGDSKVPEYPMSYYYQSTYLHDGTWTFNLPLKEVWDIYAGTPVKDVWRSTYVLFRSATAPGLELGARFFFDIKGPFIFGSVCNMAMGVEVTEIIPQKRIKFEYVNLSPAYGEQWIVFEATSANVTTVRHFTRYMGKTALLNSAYPFFHHEAIPHLHEGAKRIADKR